MGIIAVALSGGVDSLMAAYLLKQQGRDIFGLHFVSGYEAEACCDSSAGAISESKITANKQKTQDIISFLADSLSIPVKTLDLKQEFQAQVVDYFINAYQSGQTPNPCLICNPAIKFGVLFSWARQMGADVLATGHYARLLRDKNQSRLMKGNDLHKDQSYFLALVSREKLSKICFPLGTRLKSEVQKLAAEKGLSGFHQAESQDICFIRQNYGVFLAQQPGFCARPGLITDINGHILGKHQGLHLFTIGQRKGINCPGKQPYYVIRLDMQKNRLIVGFKEDLQASSFSVNRINWLIDPPVSSFQASVRVRYRSPEAPATIIPISADKAVIELDAPQMAITPGQGAVFYQGAEVLGGGWIDA